MEREDEKKLISIATCGVEFASAIVVGVFIGAWLDKYFDKFPLFFIIFFILGSIAGYLNVLRYMDNVR